MKFNFAKATNSRLMGVVGLIVSWIDDESGFFNQYFLLDAEGLGIADYTSLKNPTKQQAYIEEERLMGGLGSHRIRLSKQEALFLVKHFGLKNLEYEKELPEGVEEYIDIIQNHETKLTVNDLYKKIAKKIEDEIEFVNYMIMRFIARDRESLFYYSNNEEISNMHITQKNGTLLKTFVESRGDGRYVSEVIYEDVDGYYVCKIGMSVVKVYDEFRLGTIVVGEIDEMFDFEVFDEISKEEFISVYKVNDDMFEDKFYSKNPFVQKSFMDEGILYTRYNFDNNHVKEDVYVINNDIKALYYKVGNLFFVATYTQKDRSYINKMLVCNFKEEVELLDEYFFEENVLFDFAESGSIDFEDFLDN